MRKLLVLRHGQTAWNLEGRWQGWLDIELDDVGLVQARRRARQLAGANDGANDGECVQFAGVASSPLLRALVTARIAAAALGIEGVRTHPGLRERNGGDWQGLTRADIEERWRDDFAALRRGEIDAPPGGEHTHEMLARLHEALATIDREMPPGPLLVVTHGGIARALATEAGAPAGGVLPNVGGLWIDYDGGHTRAGAALAPLADDPAEPEGRLPVAPEVIAGGPANPQQS